MAIHHITVSGCDDSTTVMADLNDVERAALVRVAWQITRTSDFSCMPTMAVRRHVDGPELLPDAAELERLAREGY
jgi:hypothetical protein